MTQQADLRSSVDGLGCGGQISSGSTSCLAKAACLNSGWLLHKGGEAGERNGNAERHIRLFSSQTLDFDIEVKGITRLTRSESGVKYKFLWSRKCLQNRPDSLIVR